MQYGQGSVVGELGRDQVCLFPDECVEQEFVLAKKLVVLDTSTFDGLLGLALPGLAHVQQDTEAQRSSWLFFSPRTSFRAYQRVGSIPCASPSRPDPET